ncbi:hypothetical protein GQ54DRAFT_296916 [Martensiomyces pterosporus]|nr:hypothetical protein GQ54DRAFT_296916 [Martensiomyces pterosporus]
MWPAICIPASTSVSGLFFLRLLRLAYLYMCTDSCHFTTSVYTCLSFVQQYC